MSKIYEGAIDHRVVAAWYVNDTLLIDTRVLNKRHPETETSFGKPTHRCSALKVNPLRCLWGAVRAGERERAKNRRRCVPNQSLIVLRWSDTDASG